MTNTNSATIKVLDKPDLSTQLAKRPTLNDPEEYKIIKKIYFGEDLKQILGRDQTDALEKLDRMKYRSKRNQSR